ncbi:MAG: hypothetical protein U0105_15725 [Candidatus Obscuribacterales bacterium]
MKRSLCAALAIFAALIPLSSHSTDMDTTRRSAAISSAEMAEKFLREKQAEQKVTQKRTKTMRLQMAKSALMTAKRMHSNGWCYKGVTDALKPLGVELSGPAAYMAKDLLQSDPRFQPVRIEDTTQLHPGDVIVHGPTNSHPYGHIAVYLGNNHEASDHVQKVVLNAIGPYSYSVVFRYDESLIAESTADVESTEAVAAEESVSGENNTTADGLDAFEQPTSEPADLLDFVLPERG